MNCRDAQKLIPELRRGTLATGRKETLVQHLAQCETCKEWQEAWSQVCNLGMEVSLPKPDLDWSSFNQALEEELRRHPIPGRQRLVLADLWRSLVHGLSEYPRRYQLRALAAAAAAVFVIFIGRHFTSPPTVEQGHLRIGEYLVSNQEGEFVQYQGGETDRDYYQEVISTYLLEGKD